MKPPRQRASSKPSPARAPAPPPPPAEPCLGLGKAEIARLFEKMSQALALKGKDRFRILAYERAARAIRELDEDLAAVVAAERLEEIPGIGKDLAAKIAEGARTGHIQKCEREIAAFPDSLFTLFEIRGLGPKTVALLHRRYRVNDVADLRRVVASGKLASAAGFGEAKIGALRKALESWAGSQARMLLGDALPLAEKLLEQARRLPLVARAEIAGSLRRGRETVGDLDLLITSGESERALAAIAAFPEVSRVLALGPTRASLQFGHLQVDVRAVAPESFGAALVYFTGSKPHNTHLRLLARQRGLKVNEYGVFRGPERLGGASEEEVYRLLEMPLIPPELREDRGEVEAAQAGRLPALIELGDLRGDLHAHTTYSDGRSEPAAMVAAAEHLGYEYIALTDHSPGQRIARGLEPARLKRKAAELAALRRARGGRPPRILLGSEVDILPDGSLDYPDSVLAQIDVVIAAVHGNFQQSRAQMTERLLRALANPNVHVLAHPTARLINERPPIDFDFERVLRAARDAGVALELDGSPWRLDLNDLQARAAAEAGVRLAIGSDAHSAAQCAFVRFGVMQARRAWVGAETVINAWPWRKLQSWLAARRPAGYAAAS